MRAGTRLAALEILKSSTICLNDIYFSAEVTTRTVVDAGMRAVAAMILVDFPTRFAETPEDYLRKGLELHDRFCDHALIHDASPPHPPCPLPVSDGPCERTHTLANELDVPVHIHLYKTHDGGGRSPVSARPWRAVSGASGTPEPLGTESGGGAHGPDQGLEDRGYRPCQRLCGPLARRRI